jgi:hypothetical protein
MEEMIDIQIKTRMAAIRAYGTGEITLSAQLARRMKLKEGDGIKLSWGNSTFRELYISKNADGVVLRKKGNTRALRCYSVEYADVLLQGRDKGTFRVGEAVGEYHTIIYKKNYGKVD